MSEKELKKFREKVEQLNLLIESIDNVDDRRELMISCKTHEEVVSLAKTWGFEIGRRWGQST